MRTAAESEKLPASVSATPDESYEFFRAFADVMVAYIVQFNVLPLHESLTAHPDAHTNTLRAVAAGLCFTLIMYLALSML